MIDKNKYLYWLQKDAPNLEGEVVWREMYSRFGYVFHLVQMVEYNIANILSLEEFEKEAKREFTLEDIERVRELVKVKLKELSVMTFGRLKDEVKKSSYLRQMDTASLESLVKDRNWLAHHCFKERFLDQQTTSLEEVDAFIDELNDFEAKLIELNAWLIGVFKENKTKSVILRVLPV